MSVAQRELGDFDVLDGVNDEVSIAARERRAQGVKT